LAGLANHWLLCPCILQVWDDRQKIKNYEVTSLEKHGKICDPDGKTKILKTVIL